LSGPKAAVVGCAGPVLTEEERRLFREANPLGFILFARNCVDPKQLRALVESLRDTVERHDALVLIDQEGGRVARLGPPHWRKPPAASEFAAIYAKDKRAGIAAARLNARQIAAELVAVGINVDCTPVLDIPVKGADPIIGDRAYGETPEPVSVLGRAVCDGMLESGVLPVIKHIPGHGRARADSHKALPVVDTSRADLSRTDFVPFRALAEAAPCAMTAHVVYSAIDPAAPATLSREVIDEVIRGEIGFDGLLFSDDIAMGALSGPLTARTKACLAAGCDVALHCSGALDETREVLGASPPLTENATERLASALSRVGKPSA
jgi:beta-N-acetylhexosaminidase